MAITAADVTTIRRFAVGDSTGKFRYTRADVSFAVTSLGADAADMPASAFKMSEIYSVHVTRVVSSGQKLVATSTDGDNVYFHTAVNTSATADVTGTIYLTVEGNPL
jgi:phosphoheptose isomerase